MNRRGRHNVTAVAAEIDPLGKARAISGQTPGMGKVEVAPVTTGDGLDRRRERPEPLLQPPKRGIAAMFWIDIEHDQI